MRTLFIGTYTEPMPHVRGEADGIHIAALDVNPVRLLPVGTIAGPRNPSYLSLSADGARLYCVQETFADDDPRLFAYAIDEGSGQATELGSVSARGGEPCHVSLDPRRRFVYVANYGSGSAAAFPLGEDGAIIDEPTIIQHRGRGPRPRQDGPRIHAVLPDPNSDHVVVCDLGTDTVAVYRVTDRGIDPSQPVSAFASAPGAGPRQLAFSPDGTRLLVVNEFAASVDSFGYEAGIITPGDRLELLPDDWQGENFSAAVVIHPGGRFGYASNRGHDSITMFSIAPSGRLKRLGWLRGGVECPRDIAVDPDGRILLVANQNQQTIAAYHIDGESGMLTMAGEAAPFASPACLVFRPIGRERALSRAG